MLNFYFLVVVWMLEDENAQTTLQDLEAKDIQLAEDLVAKYDMV